MEKAKLKQIRKLETQIEASDATIAAIDEGLAVLAPSVAEKLLAEIDEETASGRWVMLGLVVRTMENDGSTHAHVISSNEDDRRGKLIGMISRGGLPIGFIGVAKKDAEDLSNVKVKFSVIPEVSDADTWEYLDEVAVEWQEGLQETWQEQLTKMAEAVLERHNDAVEQGLHGEVGHA